MLLSLADLDLPHPRELRFRYDVLELSTAVKPFLLQSLLTRGEAGFTPSQHPLAY